MHLHSLGKKENTLERNGVHGLLGSLPLSDFSSWFQWCLLSSYWETRFLLSWAMSSLRFRFVVCPSTVVDLPHSSLSNHYYNCLHVQTGALFSILFKILTHHTIDKRCWRLWNAESLCQCFSGFPKPSGTLPPLPHVQSDLMLMFRLSEVHMKN